MSEPSSNMRLLQRVDLEPVSENYRKTDRDLMSGRTNEQLKLYNYVKLKLACLEILIQVCYSGFFREKRQ